MTRSMLSDKENNFQYKILNQKTQLYLIHALRAIALPFVLYRFASSHLGPSIFVELNSVLVVLMDLTKKYK
jgi:hypothetical protein